MSLIMKLTVIHNGLPALSAGMADAVNEALAETASEIEQDVKGDKYGHGAPYRTGNLRRSYHVDLIPEEFRAEVGNDPAIAPYAPYVELGTRFMAPRPHLIPATEYQRDKLPARIHQKLDDLATRG